MLYFIVVERSLTMRTIISIFLTIVILSLVMDPLLARIGKVFFVHGGWVKGDISPSTDKSNGGNIILSQPKGSISIPKSDIKMIVYSDSTDKNTANFFKAFKNTRTKTQRATSPILYEPYILAASEKNSMDPELIKAVIKQESNFNYKDVSSKGAQGLMQLMPDTARRLGVEDSFDPWENIHGGTRYLRMMLEIFDGDVAKALAAYNAGPAAVQKYGDIPPYKETQGYVRKVMEYYQQYRGGKLFSYEDKKGTLILTDRPFTP